MVLIAVSMFTLVPFYGEFAVIGYAYVFTRYKWEVKEFAKYSTIMGTIDIVAQAIFIPLIRIFNLNELSHRKNETSFLQNRLLNVYGLEKSN